MKSFKQHSILFSIFAVLILTACSSGGGSGGDGTGTLSLNLTDASSSDYKAVFVTIDDVQVHLRGDENSPNNWESVDMPIRPLTIDLLKLVNGVREDLGLLELAAGEYTQMRLIIGDTPNPDDHPFANYVITNTNPTEIHELKVPSGAQTGIKIVHGFTIHADQLTEVILDFDACRSIVQAGKSGKWLLKPTIKAADPETYAIIEGKVTDDADPPMGINGVLITVQKYDDTAGIDPKDEVIIVASTLTDSLKTEAGDDIPDTEGNFSIFVEPLEDGKHYYIVAYTGGKSIDLEVIEGLGEGDTFILQEDLILSDSETGTVAGKVTLPNDFNDEHYSTLSFRQATFLNEMIEIKARNVLNTDLEETENYSVVLPVGNYTLVASTFFGWETEIIDPVIVSAGATTSTDVMFINPE
jgi:hypothetical protein